MTQITDHVPTQWRTGEPVSVGWMRQFRYFSDLFAKVSNVSGDVVECGLGEGNTFAMLAYLVGSENRTTPRTLWGFDSFEGFPNPAEHDASPRNPKKGEWKVEEAMIRERFDKSGITSEFPNLDVHITKGFLGETLPHFPDHLIAFLHLDVDLYEGYRDGLEHLYSKVMWGGVIAFDEYREYPSDYDGKEKWPGCTKAVDDFFRTHPEKMRYHEETKKYYVIKGFGS
jgi:hypothetical protein